MRDRGERVGSIGRQAADVVDGFGVRGMARLPMIFPAWPMMAPAQAASAA